jgi:DNA-binding transcriptional LysR family regulator
MTMTQIKYFIAVAKCLSFTKAADQLYVTQPALSRQITNMELELSVLLFIRTGREVKLTPAGSSLLEGLTEMYDNYCSMITKAQNLQKGLSGTLNIGVLDGANIADFMPLIYNHFLEKYPNIELDFRNASFQGLTTDLYNGKLDLAFSLHFNIINREFLKYRFVERTYDHIVLNKHHRLSNKENLTLADCKDEMFVLISPEDNAESSPLIFEACKRAGFKPKYCFASSLYEQMLWIEAGKGITILDNRMQLMMNPNIKFVRMESHWDPSLVVVWNESNHNPGIPIFLDKLDEIIGDA